MATKTTKSSTTTVGGKTYTKGDSFTDSAGRTGTVKYDAKTGAKLSDPVSSSTGYRNEIRATGADITGLQRAYAQEQAQIQAQQAALAERRKNEIAGIKTEFDIAKGAQELGQAGEYAGRATQLVTSGGGFLGATQSQQGVLQNLKSTHEAEKTALMAKREAAINAANTAYEDKDFQLARELTKSARDLQSEIYKREQDFADQILKTSTYNRSFADDKAKAYAMLSDEDYAKLTPSQKNEVDKFFTPGYMDIYRASAQASAKGKSVENDIDLRNKIQTLINKTPQGQKITLPDGTVYMGMKKPSSASSSGLISSALAIQLGVPSLAGKDESDIILSLALDNPPAWYKEYYKANAPDIYSKLTPEQLKSDWKIFKAQPDIQAYKNSSVVTKRIEVQSFIQPSTEDVSVLDE